MSRRKATLDARVDPAEELLDEQPVDAALEPEVAPEPEPAVDSPADDPALLAKAWEAWKALNLLIQGEHLPRTRAALGIAPKELIEELLRQCGYAVHSGHDTSEVEGGNPHPHLVKL